MSTRQLSLAEIQRDLDSMYDEFSVVFDLKQHPDAVLDRAAYLQKAILHSAKLIADAKYRRAEFLNGTIAATIREALGEAKWPDGITKLKIESAAMEYTHAVAMSERLNAMLTHSHQMCISAISKYKEEVKAFGSQHSR